MKYSKSQREEIAQGVFKNSNEPHFYVSSNATFYNERQYQAQDEATQKDCVKLENPKFKKQESDSENKKPVQLEKMKVDELKAYALEKGIELSADDTSKAAIIGKIKEAEDNQE